MSNNSNSLGKNTSDISLVCNERRSNPRKGRKKDNRSINISVPVTFNPSPFPEIRPEDQLTKILNYSENDFPVLGTSSKKNSNRIYNDAGRLECPADPNSVSKSNSFRNEKLSTRLLKSNKHKEAFKVNFEEIFSNISTKSSPAPKIRPVKHFKEGISLSGNPLDSDNPIRKRGIVNTKPKLKRISCTKAMVYEARKEMQRLKAISEQIALKDGKIHTTSDTPVDELWKPLCFFKAKDIKACLKTSLDDIRNENDVEEVEFSNAAESDLNEMYKNSTPQRLESVCSIDNESSTESTGAISLEKVLENSTIPPYKLLIHDGNFKRYCDNCITSELNNATEKLVNQLVRYQYKKFQIDPLKASAKKRYVLGLRQVKKYVKMNKIKLIIFVPNMEESLYETVEELKSLATAYCIPYLFAFSRKKLGKISYKKIGVSCFGVLDYSGAEENFKNCVEVLTRTKKMYVDKCSAAQSHYEKYVSSGAIAINPQQIEQDVYEEIEKNFMLKLSLKDEDDILYISE